MTDPSPQDAAANLSSPGNAVAHGMTATKLLPKILKPGRVAELFGQLCIEFRPATLSERLVAREAARHAAMLELGEVGESAVLAQGAMQVTAVIAEADDDLIVAAAVTSEPLERFARYRRTHEKALFQALGKLHELQATRRDQNQSATLPEFSEDHCKRQLRARFDSAQWTCPRCGNATGCWLPSRDVWECRGCRKQIGLRYGTVLERSPLSVTLWAGAIFLVTTNEAITAAELAVQLKLGRPATAQKMLERIRAALVADDAPARLAGLQQLILHQPEASV